VHPGFIECHNHATIHTARGAISDTISWDDVSQDFYVPYWNTVTDEEEHAGTLLACLEMIRNGTTTFLESGTALEPAWRAATGGHPDAIGDPFLDVGGFHSKRPVIVRRGIDRAPAGGSCGGNDPDGGPRPSRSWAWLGVGHGRSRQAGGKAGVCNQHQTSGRTSDARHGSTRWCTSRRSACWGGTRSPT
jgi:hypothetical protein